MTRARGADPTVGSSSSSGAIPSDHGELFSAEGEMLLETYLETIDDLTEKIEWER